MRRVAPVLLFIAVLLYQAHGQTLSNKGRDFRLTFLPNYHNYYNNQTLRLRDSLCIFVVTETPTSGTITYRNRAGATMTAQFTTTQPGEIYTFRVTAINHELEGFNRSNTLINNSQNEAVAPQSFHIAVNNDVTVFALNQAETTSDAALILPTPALGLRYFVMSYQSDARTDFQNNLTGQSTPSEFAVVATDNNTRITIRPTAPTLRNGTATQTRTLQRGDVYLVQAAVAAGSKWGDLTGTEVTADKPVAVFGGHQRATIPIQDVSDLFSRDMLFEQMPPAESWGTLHIVSPFAPPASQIAIGTDIFRVVAGYDATIVEVDGVRRGVLMRGQKLDLPLTAPAIVRSSQPVMVAEFKKSSGDSRDATRMGDPFMVIVPPREQYLPAYRTMNIQAMYPLNGATRPDTIVYREHFVSVVIPQRALKSLRIDDAAPDTSKLTAVPTSQTAGLCTPTKAGWIRVPWGAHTVTASEPFGLTIYGYGQANSYGYTGGISLEKGADVKPVKAGGGRRICRGDSALLGATGGRGGYAWQPAAALSCADCPNPTARPTQTTTYRVLSFDAGDCPIADSVTVEVTFATADAVPDTTICAGGRAQLGATGGVSYRWFPPAGLSCTDCPNPAATPAATTTYFVTVTNKDGCMAADSVTVSISISVADAGRDTAICKGDSLRLAANGGERYEWFPPVGLSCTDCPGPVARPVQTTTYRVRATNRYGCTAEDSVTITVGETQTVVNTSAAMCAGDSVQLSASGGKSYRWSPPDGLSCTDCPNPVARPTHTRTYTVEVDNGSGCLTIENVLVTVRECSPQFLRFGRVLSCDAPTQVVLFVNRDSLPVRFFGLRPLDAAAALFLLDYAPPVPANVAPGDTVIVGVTYLAEGDAATTARYRFLTSADSSRECIVSGSSYTVPAEFTLIAPDTAAPGNMTTPFTIRARSAYWEQAALTAVRAEIIWKTELFFYDDSLNAAQTGEGAPYGWDVQTSAAIVGDSTILTIAGSGAAPVARDCDLFRFSLGTMLGNSEFPALHLSADVGLRGRCVIPSARGAVMQIATCALPIRFVKGTGKGYFLRAVAGGRVQVEYGVGLAANALVQIFSATGELAATLASGHCAAGEYRAGLPPFALAQGVYFCRLTSGPFVQSIPLIITE